MLVSNEMSKELTFMYDYFIEIDHYMIVYSVHCTLAKIHCPVDSDGGIWREGSGVGGV